MNLASESIARLVAAGVEVSKASLAARLRLQLPTVVITAVRLSIGCGLILGLNRFLGLGHFEEIAWIMAIGGPVLFVTLIQSARSRMRTDGTIATFKLNQADARFLSSGFATDLTQPLRAAYAELSYWGDEVQFVQGLTSVTLARAQVRITLLITRRGSLVGVSFTHEDDVRVMPAFGHV